MKLSSPSLAVAVLLCLSSSASTALHAAPKEWKPAAWKVPPEQYDEVTTVDAKTGKLTIEHKGGKDTVTRYVTVGPFTEITVEDKRSTLAAIKPGMHVDYVLGGGGIVLASLATKPPQKPPPTPAPTATPSFPKGAPKPGTH